jgi:peptidoglycan/LPS O-acetylase OafA/YrhL
MTQATEPAGRGRSLPQLDNLRGLAIIPVALLHGVVPSPSSPGATTMKLPLSVGWVGVDLFFALSGYLITSILLRS